MIKTTFLSLSKSTLANRFLRVSAIILAGMFLLSVLVLWFAIIEVDEQNRIDNIEQTMTRVEPLLSESLWLYDDSGLAITAEILAYESQIVAIFIKNDVDELVFSKGDGDVLAGLVTTKDLLPLTTALPNDMMAFVSPISHVMPDGSTTYLGAITVVSDNSIDWTRLQGVMAVVALSLLVLHCILGIIIYLTLEQFLSRRLAAFGRHIDQLEAAPFSKPAPDIRALTKIDDELTDIYFRYRAALRKLHAAALDSDRYQKQLDATVDARTAELHHINAYLVDPMQKLSMAKNDILEQGKLASLARLVSGLLHEVNTPLGIAVTGMSLMSESIDVLQIAVTDGTLTRSDMDAFFVDSTENCRLIEANLKRTSELMMAFKNISVDQANHVCRTVKVGDYIGNVVRAVRIKFKRSKVDVVTHIDGEIELNTYPGALSQVVINLIVNAYEHGYRNGESAGDITVSVGWLEEQNPDAGVLVTVSDKGVGMSDDTKAQMFEPFFTTRRELGGSGLGLNIAQNLVDKVLNGRIDCESVEGEGTQFRVLIRNIPQANTHLIG